MAISGRVAAWLAARGASANAISVAGLVAAVFAGVAFWSTGHTEWPAWIGFLAGAVLVQLRLAANMFDGMVAIARGTASPVGELYNEVPDRISDTAVLVGLGYATGGHVALGYAAALAAMFTAYVRAQGGVAGAPQAFEGPMAKPQRMFLVTIAALWLALTPVTWHPVVDAHGLATIVLALVTLGSVVTAVRRLLRVARNLRGGSE